jgi:Tol biopolymer transport system component
MLMLKHTAKRAAACLVVAVAVSSQAWAGVATELVSVGPLGVLPNNISEEPSISADGRFVAFSSLANNLVAGDTNGKRDVFVRDRMTQTTTRVSLGSCQYRGGCAQSNDDSDHPRISADGRFVAFESYAGNLVAGNGGITIKRRNVFIRDRLTGTTKQVSVSSSGVQGNNDSEWPSLSADGRFVAFASLATNLITNDTNNVLDVFVRDTLSVTTTRVSVRCFKIPGLVCLQGNGASFWPSISANGKFVSFSSEAQNFVTGDPYLEYELYIVDLTTHTLESGSVGLSGENGNMGATTSALSADGRFVAFTSASDNLLGVFGTDDQNYYTDVFVRDHLKGTIALASISTGGLQGNDVSKYPSISADGRFVGFESVSDNLVSGDTNHHVDAFVRDRLLNTTTRVSLSKFGAQGNADSSNCVLSADGHFVAFQSTATDLVFGGGSGIFVRAFAP